MTEHRLHELLLPFLPATDPFPPDLLHRLRVYLDLLLRWNARTNLTAIRDPEAIVTRHFGESLFAATRLPETGSLLDFGSGAGFPGLPVQLLHPHLSVTLAEAQGKKAAFLREVIRTLALPAAVWPHRAETLPAGTAFDVITLRAVDSMPTALRRAATLTRQTLCILAGSQESGIATLENYFSFTREPVPVSTNRFLLVGSRRVLDGQATGQNR